MAHTQQPHLGAATGRCRVGHLQHGHRVPQAGGQLGLARDRGRQGLRGGRPRRRHEIEAHAQDWCRCRPLRLTCALAAAGACISVA